MLKQSISTSVRTAPGPHTYPIIGCLPQMLGDRLKFLTESARQYGDVVRLGAIGPQQLYLVTHPDGVKQVLQENAQNYTKGANFKNKDIDLLIGKGLVNNEGDSWRRQRRMMQPAFHRQRVANLVTDMTTIIAQMLETWRAIKPNMPLDISTEMLRLTQKIVLKTLLSIEDSSEITELTKAWDVVFNFHRERIWAFFKLPVDFPTPKNLRFVQAVRTLSESAERAIREHQPGDSAPNDLLSMLIEARDESGEGMSNEQLRDEVMALYTAGFETSGTALGWIWYLLAKHPSIESKLQVELTTVLGGRTPTFADLPNLKYTKMIVEEAMRLYPAVWLNSRTALADDEIGGYHIPAGSMILLSPLVTHHLPAFWKNSEDFDPERFTPERSIGRPRHAYYPFGGGPRQCLGDVFAMTEIQLTVAMVSQNFRLSLVPEHPVEQRALLTLEPRNGILVTLEPRNLASKAS